MNKLLSYIKYLIIHCLKKKIYSIKNVFTRKINSAGHFLRHINHVQFHEIHESIIIIKKQSINHTKIFLTFKLMIPLLLHILTLNKRIVTIILYLSGELFIAIKDIFKYC